MIRHSVVFKLKHPKNSHEENEFFRAAFKLASIPSVQQFECLRQISKKNSFDYGISMEFNSVKEYDFYNEHSDHVEFVKTYWTRDVEDFLEIDYQPLDI